MKGWKEILVREKIRLGKGEGELMWLRHVILAVAGAEIIYASWFNVSMPLGVMIILGLAYLVGCHAVGYWWDRNNLFIEEAEFSNRRNRFTEEVRNHIKQKPEEKE